MSVSKTYAIDVGLFCTMTGDPAVPDQMCNVVCTWDPPGVTLTDAQQTAYTAAALDFVQTLAAGVV